jgi:hypothetical protein
MDCSLNKIHFIFKWHMNERLIVRGKSEGYEKTDEFRCIIGIRDKGRDSCKNSNDSAGNRVTMELDFVCIEAEGEDVIKLVQKQCLVGSKDLLDEGCI